MRRIAVLASLTALFAACWYEVGDLQQGEGDATGSAGAAGSGTGGTASTGGGDSAGGGGQSAGEGGSAGTAGSSGSSGGATTVGEFLECELLGYAGGCFGNDLLIYFSAAHDCNDGAANGHCYLNRCGISGTCGTLTCSGGAPNAVCLPDEAPTFIDCAIGVSVDGDCIDGVAVRQTGVSCIYNDCVARGATCMQPPDVNTADCYSR